jgi:hypothetical protein
MRTFTDSGTVGIKIKNDIKLRDADIIYCRKTDTCQFSDSMFFAFNCENFQKTTPATRIESKLGYYGVSNFGQSKNKHYHYFIVDNGISLGNSELEIIVFKFEYLIVLAS